MAIRRNSKKYAWQEEIIKYLMDKYSINYSEIVRTLVSIGLCCVAERRYPKHKTDYSKLKNFFKPSDISRSEIERYHELLNYEARKFSEYLLKNHPLK